MSFIPTPFTTPVLAPQTATMFRATSYISPSEYRFAPTAVSTLNLVAGSTNQEADSLASLAQVISRVSGQIDTYCFHRAEGTLAASVTIESAWVKSKLNGSLVLICNFKPIIQVVGVGIGPSPSQVQNIDSSSSADISIGNKTITLPGTWASGVIRPYFGGWPSTNGLCYVVWSYVSGYPHNSLDAPVSAGASSITVSPSTPDGTGISGVYAGTQLTIHDGMNTEVVVSSGIPSGLVINTVDPLQYDHTPPAQPDFMRVSAMPYAIEQATISLTSMYVKMQGTRAMNLPALGSKPAAQSAGRAGMSKDYEEAMDLLQPFRTAYIRST